MCVAACNVGRGLSLFPGAGGGDGSAVCLFSPLVERGVLHLYVWECLFELEKILLVPHWLQALGMILHSVCIPPVLVLVSLITRMDCCHGGTAAMW